MAVIQLSYYSNTDTSIEDMQNTLDANFIGHHQVTLTEWGTDTVPQVAIGSVVENNGALFKFTANTSIFGSPSDGTVYIYLVPSGDPAAGTATVTPTFTNTAPTWSDSKQGFYGTGSYANYRYLEFKITKSDPYYTGKRVLENATYIDTLSIKNETVAYLRVDSTDTVTGTPSLTIDGNGTIELETGSEINYKGSGCFGFNSDGTAMRCKAITVTTDTVGSGSKAHSISAAYSLNKIRSISGFIDLGVGGRMDINSNYVNTRVADVADSRIWWDDTNIYIVGGVVSESYSIFIIYTV